MQGFGRPRLDIIGLNKCWDGERRHWGGRNRNKAPPRKRVVRANKKGRNGNRPWGLYVVRRDRQKSQEM